MDEMVYWVSEAKCLMVHCSQTGPKQQLERAKTNGTPIGQAMAISSTNPRCGGMEGSVVHNHKVWLQVDTAMLLLVV
jgi:hypothetical protein